MNLLLLGLWTLDARVVVETFVVICKAVREPPIPLWVVPQIAVERLRIPPRRIPIVEGEPNLCGAVNRRKG